MTADEAIHQRITSSAAVVARAGGRVFAGWRPPRTPTPCVAWFRVSTVPTGSAGCDAALDNLRVEVDVWAATPAEARAIADAVRAVLHGWTRTASPGLSCSLRTENDLVEDDPHGGNPEYRVSQDYSLWLETT